MSVDVVHCPAALTDRVDEACSVIRSVRRERSEDESAELPPTEIDLTGGRTHFCDDEDVSSLMEAWKDGECPVPAHITSLDLSLNRISDEGVKHIAETVGKRQGGQLKNIDLDGNDLTDAAVEQLAENLLRVRDGFTPTLTRLDLSSNHITNRGVQALVSACVESGNSTLQTIIIRSNDITDGGMECLCAWLEEASCPLKILHVSGNTFSEGVIAPLAKALAVNTSLTDLNISNTIPQLTDPKPLVSAVESNESLLTLSMGFGGKKFRHEAIDAALQRNRLAERRRGEFVEQLKASHRREIEALKAEHEKHVASLENEIAELRAKVAAQ